jgi:ATP-dependent RNA helicase RhlE
LVATPGRLLDLHNQKAVKLNQIQILVLDEADHMLDMGFIHDIKKIIALTPSDRQNLLFSATFSPEIKKLAKTLGSDLVEIASESANTTVNAIKQIVYKVDRNQKSNLLSHLIHSEQWPQALVFSRTKHGSEKIAKKLIASEIKTATIHGDKTQGARTRALREFKEKDVQVLVATDVAARGIDISNLPYVVNFDMPTYPNDYIHRIGRTGRAGKQGTAISFLSIEEHKFLRGIEELIGAKIQQKIEEGFRPLEKKDSEKRSDNFKSKKSGYKKRQATKKVKTNFKKSETNSNKNKKKGSKAKTRWKKGKGS